MFTLIPSILGKHNKEDGGQVTFASYGQNFFIIKDGQKYTIPFDLVNKFTPGAFPRERNVFSMTINADSFSWVFNESINFPTVVQVKL